LDSGTGQIVSEQTENLERVSARIGGSIVSFCRRRIDNGDRTFHMIDLTEWVSSIHPIAPDSAGRILRDLRQRGKVRYRLLSRSQSWYEVLDVRCKS
jgi:hypothetical protein